MRAAEAARGHANEFGLGATAASLLADSNYHRGDVDDDGGEGTQASPPYVCLACGNELACPEEACARCGGGAPPGHSTPARSFTWRRPDPRALGAFSTLGTNHGPPLRQNVLFGKDGEREPDHSVCNKAMHGGGAPRCAIPPLLCLNTG